MKRHKTVNDPAPRFPHGDTMNTSEKASAWARKHPANYGLSGFKRPKSWRWARLYPESGSPDSAPGTSSPGQ